MVEKKVGVGVGVLIIKDNRILLGKRHDDPKKAESKLKGEGTWTCPGGKLEFGEGFEQAAGRELEEETGMILKRASVVCINNDRGESAHFITIGLVAEEYEGMPKVMEPNEIIEWGWFDLDNLPRPLYFPSERAIECYRKKRFYIKRD